MSKAEGSYRAAVDKGLVSKFAQDYVAELEAALRLMAEMKDEAEHQVEQAEAEVAERDNETAATIVRLTAEIDDYADRLAERERMLRLVKSLLPLPADGTPLDDWLADLRARAGSDQ